MADAVAYNPSELRILVVDDNQQMRSILKSMLNGFGVTQIVPAVDGADALDKLAAQTFDVAICDWLMSPMDGISFVQEVRKHPVAVLRALPILMLTAQKEMRNVLDARSAGVDAYVGPLSSAPSTFRPPNRALPPRPSWPRRAACHIWPTPIATCCDWIATIWRAAWVCC